MMRGTLLCALLWALPAPSWSAEALSNKTCMECHADAELTTERNGRNVSMYVDANVFAKSVHADVECISCHADIEEVPHAETLAKVDCAVCHDDAAVAFAESIHGRRQKEHDADAPGCATCHGTHDILQVSDPNARVSRMNMVHVCIDCHEDEDVTNRHSRLKPDVIKAYAASVHGHGFFDEGLTVSAVCTDCHGTHQIEPADDPKSPAYRTNIPKLCGRCHPDIANIYGESIHGKAVAAGVEDAPVCTDCHGEHTIASPTDPTSQVAPKNIPKTCGTCHENARLVQKYGLPTHRYTTYLNSYHGIVNQYGKATVANCSTCHGVHNIRPSSDPESTIYPSNLGKTCGGCHPGSAANLAGVTIHVEATPESSKGMFWVRRFYTYFIGLLVVGFLVHITVDIIGFLRRRRLT